MTYKDINLRKLIQLREVLSDSDYDELHIQSSLIAILNDKSEDEVLSLKLSEYSKKVAELDFLLESPKITKRCPDKIILGEEKYNVIKDVRKLTAGQFIDYETLIADTDNQERNLPSIIACFVMPEGKEYGEYDVLEVADKVAKYMNAEMALEISSFFRQQSLLYTKATLRYLEGRLKKEIRREKNPETKQTLKEALTKMKEYRDLVKNGVGYIG